MKNRVNKKMEQSLYVSDDNNFFENYYIIIKNNKMDFFIWVVISIVVALIGVWLPCLIHLLMKTSKDYQFKEVQVYKNLLKGNPYILYSITFLAETFLSTISIKSIVKNDTTKRDKKIIWGIIVLFFIIVMAVIMVISNIIEIKINNLLQHIILIIAILIGLLLYPLKDNLYEPTANSRNTEQEKEMEDLAKSTKSKEDLLDD